MKNLKSLRKAAVFALLLVSCSAFSQDLKLDTKFNGKGSFKKTKRVYIAAFDVNQYITASASAMAGGGGAFAKMTVNFGGVDGDAYQAMVGEVYADAVKKLTSLGYEVVSNDEATGKLKDPQTFNSVGKPEKMMSGTASGVIVRPKNVSFDPAWGITYVLHYNKIAKSVDANTLYFSLSLSTVDFGKSGRFARKASVNAEPGLTLTGMMGAASFDGKGAGISMLKEGGRHEQDDWVGTKGLYETSSSDTPWMGSSKGKYTLDIDQTNYLAAVKQLLTAMVTQSIDAYNQEINN